MKLLFIIDSLGSGGAQRQIVNLATGLKKKGYEVNLFTYFPEYTHFKDELDYENIEIYSIPKNGRYSLGVIRKLANLIKKNKYDVVISYLDTPNFYAEIAKLLNDSFSLIVSERNTYPFGYISHKKRLLEQLHRVADKIVVNSHYHRIILENKYNWLKNKINTIYNGVDLKRYSPQYKYTYKNNFLVIGSLKRQKNPIGLINAIKIYRDKYYNDIKINWAGRINDVPKEEFSLYSKATKLITEYGLEGNWNWLGERSDIHTLLTDHDALILPSFFEGLPNAVCEAFACGKPVLASKVCEHPRIITEGKNGFLFDPNNPEDIADVIHKYNNLSIELKHKMGYYAREYAEDELSNDIFVNRYESLALDLVNG